jgi:hypothetical protein
VPLVRASPALLARRVLPGLQAREVRSERRARLAIAWPVLPVNRVLWVRSASKVRPARPAPKVKWQWVQSVQLALSVLPDYKATQEPRVLKVPARSALPAQSALPDPPEHKGSPETRALKVRLRLVLKVPLAQSVQPDRKA